MTNDKLAATGYDPALDRLERVERLREAARTIRGRAEAATLGPWTEYVLGSEGYEVRGATFTPEGSLIPRRARVARCGYETWDTDKANAEHIATWDPTVALAVATWLDSVAETHQPDPDPIELTLHPDEECPTGECEEYGHSSIVCRGCYPSWEDMPAHSVWPCAEFIRAEPVALTILGIAS